MAKTLTQSDAAAPGQPAAPGRLLKSRLRAGDVLVGGMIVEYLRPSLVKLYRQAGFLVAYSYCTGQFRRKM